MSIRSLKWILLAPVLSVLLFGHSFGYKGPIPPSGQPAQIRSEVKYDPKLSDPFFKSKEWSYPWWIARHDDGSIENTTGGPTDERKPPRLKHTAKCFSTSDGSKHEMRFCEARVFDANTIELFINESSVGEHDALRIQIRNGMFTS
jgi:hypothetical protein